MTKVFKLKKSDEGNDLLEITEETKTVKEFNLVDYINKLLNQYNIVVDSMLAKKERANEISNELQEIKNVGAELIVPELIE